MRDLSLTRQLSRVAWIALAAFLAAVPGCRRASDGARARSGPPPIAVEIVRVETGTIRERLERVGELRAAESVVVRSEVAGVIDAIALREGQVVSRGTLLIRLRDGEQRARLREARARRALAEDEFRRMQRLASRNAAAEAQLERARAELEAARAREQLAQVELERTRIRAPFDGAVGAREVSPGERVTPETPLVRFDAIHRLQALFSVPETVLPRVQVGMHVEVRVAAYPGERFPGRVFFVAPTVDAPTRQLPLKAWVPNPDGKLRPGMFARVELLLGERSGLLIPEEAVVRDRTAAFVWRVDARGRAERVAIVLGMREAGRVEVREGLAAGDRVVGAGTHKVFAGARLVQAAAARGGPGPSPPARAAGEGGSG